MAVKILRSGFIVACAVFLSTAVLAQNTVPDAAKSGIIEDKFRRDTQSLPESIPEQTGLSEEVIEDQRPNLPSSPQDTTGKVYIEKFVLSGVLQFDAEEFVPLLSPYKNTYLGLDDLNKIADTVQQYYRSSGYISTFVYIPVQEIRNKTVEIRVVEGHIGQIQVEGAKYFDPERIRQKAGIREGDTILYRDFMTKLIKLNQHPDRTVKAILTPGERLESTDIILKVTDQSPRHMFVEYNNNGTKYTGRSRFTTGYTDNNLLGRDDVLSLRYQMSDKDLYGGSVDYNVPIGSSDTRVGAYVSAVDVEVGREFRALGAEGDAFTTGVYAKQPIEGLAVPVNVLGGLDVKRSRNRLLNETISDDRLTVAKLAVATGINDGYGRSSGNVELNQGLAGVLGSMDDDTRSSRSGADGAFTKFKLDAGRTQYLPLKSILVLRGRGQWSPDKLVNPEQYYIGGADTVRGYPELEFGGDYGFTTNLEVYTPAFMIPPDLKLGLDDKYSLREKMKMVYFWDFGKAYMDDPLAGQSESADLSSVGVGLRLQPRKDFYLALDWGVPVGADDPSDGSSSRVHFLGRWEVF